MFFMIGIIKSKVFDRPLIASGLRTLLTRGTATGLAFYTGFILREIFE